MSNTGNEFPPTEKIAIMIDYCMGSEYGRSANDISEKLGCSIRTARRLMSLIIGMEDEFSAMEIDIIDDFENAQGRPLRRLRILTR